VQVFYRGACPHAGPRTWRAEMPSSRAARCQALWAGRVTGAGAVSTRNCSSAATIAAASPAEPAAVSSSIRGRGGRRSPFRAPAIAAESNLTAMGDVAIFDAKAVFGAVTPAEAIARTRTAFERGAAGEWEMPAKVYVDAPPHGDFRAMPARGGSLATLKWVTSFPHNPERGLPVVAGALLASSAETGELVAIMDCAAITSLRTGAAAAVSAQALARSDAATVGVIGCGVNGAWAARCLAAAGYGPGVCFDPRPEAAEALAAELGWESATREAAVGQDIVVTVTPASAPVVHESDLRPGQHIAALGADAHGKGEIEHAALALCRLFCDEWEQASKGGELSGAVTAGAVTRADVTEIGAVLLGNADGRRSADEITLFDSTGLAIQDLAIAAAVLEARDRGAVEVPAIEL
jgi:alanine dehydrogenase